jgi:hypothetical protein
MRNREDLELYSSFVKDFISDYTKTSYAKALKSTRVREMMVRLIKAGLLDILKRYNEGDAKDVAEALVKVAYVTRLHPHRAEDVEKVYTLLTKYQNIGPNLVIQLGYGVEERGRKFLKRFLKIMESPVVESFLKKTDGMSNSEYAEDIAWSLGMLIRKVEGDKELATEASKVLEHYIDTPVVAATVAERFVDCADLLQHWNERFLKDSFWLRCMFGRPPLWRKYFKKIIEKLGKPEVVKFLKSYEEEEEKAKSAALDLCIAVCDTVFEEFESSVGGPKL